MKTLSCAAAALAVICFASTSASAGSVVVDAFGDSISGGPLGGAVAGTLTAGQAFTVTVPTAELWSAGALPRWSNADGLTGDLFATGSDASGQPAGTLIGQNFGLFNTDGLSAPFGALVGEIGAGPFFLIGTNYSGVASASGQLKLYYWDSNFDDNSGSVTATFNAVPEPATWALMGLGFAGLAGLGLRAQRRSAIPV